MINRKRKLLPVLAAVSLMLAGLSGCGGHAEPPLEAAAYSNLTDAASRGLLSESLADSGISENRVSILLDRVDQFNASVKNEWLTEGFESGAPTDTKYDPYEMQELWTEKNGSFPGYNRKRRARTPSLWILKRWPQIPPFSAETAHPNSVRCLRR